MQMRQGFDAQHGGELFPVNELVVDPAARNLRTTWGRRARNFTDPHPLEANTATHAHALGLLPVHRWNAWFKELTIE